MNKTIEYQGATYEVIRQDSWMAIVRDFATNEYGIYGDGEVLMCASKADAEYEFTLGDL